MLIEKLPHAVTLVAIYFAYGSIFLLAGGGKFLERGIPDWFEKQFLNTFLVKVPGLAFCYLSIALLEIFVSLLILVSAVKLEFLPGNETFYLQSAVALASVIFGILGFGQRLSQDYAGAANSFFYLGATLITQIYLAKAF